MTSSYLGSAAAIPGYTPIAPMIGPFPMPGFLGAWADHRGVDLIVVDDDDAAIVLWHDQGTVRFAGEADLTDYHSPLGSPAESLFERLSEMFDAGTPLSFDSLPVEAADVVDAGLAKAGLITTRRRHEVAAVLSLGTSHEDYLGGLDKKQRHEVRRKRRRFDDAYGSARLERRSDAFGVFVDMHRSAPGDKGEFMTADMVEFFDALLATGFVLDVLATADGDAVAAAFGYEDEHAYYLYNSAFDPDAGHASPGVILVDVLIEQAIAAGKSRFDFLKGDEVYKFRLGASERPLYVVEAML